MKQDDAAAIAALRDMLRADGKVIPDWEWFFAPERKERTESLDRRISSYPDGKTVPHYIEYMRENAAQLQEYQHETDRE